VNETPHGGNQPEYRALMLTPNPQDAALTRSVLGDAGVTVAVCRDVDRLHREVAVGAGCLMVAEEAITPAVRRALAEVIEGQPPWSDLPILVLTRIGANSETASAALASLGNVALLERPVRVATLVSAVRVALRARRRQYDLRSRFEAQALLATIVATSEDAIISKDLEGVITSWNLGAQRLFGYTAQEAIGRPVTMLMAPERHHEAFDILLRIRRGERLEHYETERVRKDGTRVQVSLSVSPLITADGQIIGASKIARDITAPKLAEQALREADRRKDEFLATLAHELRNPLAPIRNSLHLLELSGNTSSAVEYVRAMMERQVNHMVRMVDDLMEVSRITRGKIELRRERVDLDSVIRSAIETSQPWFDAAGHRLDLSIPAEPLVLDADPVRLAQVFANLLNNAAKYTEQPGTIRVAARREDGGVTVSVRDSGIGIPAEMLPRVFEMFAQIDSARGRSQGGLGIGLTLVRKLVDMHGGTVSAHSEGPGTGSEFVVRLPLTDGAAAKRPSARAMPPELLPLRVLVVDDNRDAANSLGMLLKFLGAEIHLAYDGFEAIAALESFGADLVLLDIGMPGMDGYEVARRIRRHPKLADLKLIALTGWGQEEDRRRTAAAGFDHHLIKPTGIEALRALMVTVGARDTRREAVATRAANAG
jgi:two-component system, chemotaxis family, CheB/CheR fusion protein